MVKCVILHIGIHKTGSTAIQDSLADFDDGFCFYADLGPKNHSIALFTAFSKDYSNYHIWKNQGKTEQFVSEKRREFREALAKNLDREDRQTVILSGEDVSMLSDDEALELVTTLKGQGRELKIVCYLRDPMSYAASAFQELLKVGMHSIPEKISPQYRFRLAKFISASGRDSMIIKNFDRETLKGGSVVEDFCETIGISAATSAPDANASMTLNAARALFLFGSSNKFFHGDQALWRGYQMFMSLVQNEFKNGERINVRRFAPCADYSELDWLHHEFGFMFNRNETLDAKGDIGGHKALSDYMLDTDDEFNDGIRNILDGLGVSTPLESPSALLSRLYYKCVSGYDEEDTRAELENTRAERNSMCAELENANAERNSMCAELENVHAERNSLCAEMENTRAERNSLCAELKNAYAERDSLRTELENTHAERNSFCAELGRVRAESELMKSELDDARARRSKLAEYIDRLDYLVHLRISRTRFLPKSTRCGFTSAAKRRERASYMK